MILYRSSKFYYRRNNFSTKTIYISYPIKVYHNIIKAQHTGLNSRNISYI